MVQGRFLAVLSGAAALLLGTATPLLAQHPPPPTAPTSAPAAPAGYAVLHVHPTAGHDGGEGSQMTPLATITEALRRAEPNTIIVLAPGEYSAASGEQFPLQLKPGVTIQGSPAFGTAVPVIRGSGIHTLPSGQLLAVTVVAADRAGLGHLTVTNDRSNGYGLLVVGTSPVVRGNAFVHNGQGGIYVIGGQPTIEGNLFAHNGRVGLWIEGESTAQVVGNQFAQTGTGIQVTAGASPTLRQNLINYNHDGVVVAAGSHPQFVDNQISDNRRNAVVELADPQIAVAEPASAETPSLPPPPPPAPPPPPPHPPPQKQPWCPQANLCQPLSLSLN